MESAVGAAVSLISDGDVAGVIHTAEPDKTGIDIYLGIGGWNFEPWRGVFYPKGLPHAKELEYASTHLTSIEINATFYRSQTPATFRKWASEVPAASSRSSPW